MFAGHGPREEEVASEPLFNIGDDVPTLKKSKKSAGKKKSQQTKTGKEDGEMVPTVDEDNASKVYEDDEYRMEGGYEDGDGDWMSLNDPPPRQEKPIPVMTRPLAHSGHPPKMIDPYAQIRHSLIESLDAGNFGFDKQKIARCVNTTITHDQLENIICNKLMRE
jgi:hypothetical protein